MATNVYRMVTGLVDSPLSLKVIKLNNCFLSRRFRGFTQKIGFKSINLRAVFLSINLVVLEQRLIRLELRR
jgi:hypothetical protein